MNVVAQVSRIDPVPREDVVAAGAYVDGRRVANISIEEASSWRNKPGHIVWPGHGAERPRLNCGSHKSQPRTSTR